MQLSLLSLSKWYKQTGLTVWKSYFSHGLNYQVVTLLLQGLLLNLLGGSSGFSLLAAAADDSGEQNEENGNQEKYCKIPAKVALDRSHLRQPYSLSRALLAFSAKTRVK
ncbi:Hypothetical_protein [Hexamita inflata]|uniref:Hypothetical_protein n=1 Tax=Hexamita inflata TaxID=28002 RepID=A0AA86R7D9_9EUKA|nr:Hypothetical protein HINF_LOCUS55059 [Hexamita inflata]